MKQKRAAGNLSSIVRTHPENGRKAIYNPIRIETIAGMKETDAQLLLCELLQHAIQERFQYRHKWKQGDLVMWDNRCLLHKANGDYDHETQSQYLYRVSCRAISHFSQIIIH